MPYKRVNQLNLERAIKKLPTDLNEIADFLKKKGVKGRRSFPDRCPIANYLKAEFPDAEHVYAFIQHAVLQDEKGRQVRCEMPSTVRVFIQNFDHHKMYDELVKN